MATYSELVLLHAWMPSYIDYHVSLYSLLFKPCLPTLVYYAYTCYWYGCLPSGLVCYAYTYSLVCAHVYALSLICPPIVYYTYSYLFTCMPSYLD